MTATATRKDHYASITTSIVSQLEQGVRPWHQPWKAKHAAGAITRPLRANGQPYHGINVLVLWLTAYERGYISPIYMTFQQAKELGAFVKKGEKGTGIVYANAIEKTETDAETGEERKERIPFLKGYTVFNVEQIEGLPGHFYAQAEHPLPLAERLDHAERFFANTKADIRHGGDRAFYRPADDFIQMPAFETFASRESYYSTLAHECTHWTKTEHRLNRSFDSKRFGDDGYAMEELVAELGAAFVCADLGICPEVMPEHASYLDAWLKVLKADTKAIFTAAAHAERAAEYLQQLQPPPASTPEPTPQPFGREDAEATETLQRMNAALERSDFLTVRDLAEQLQQQADQGRRPAGLDARTLQDCIRSAQNRAIYPD